MDYNKNRYPLKSPVVYPAFLASYLELNVAQSVTFSYLHPVFWYFSGRNPEWVLHLTLKSNSQLCEDPSHVEPMRWCLLGSGPSVSRKAGDNLEGKSQRTAATVELAMPLWCASFHCVSIWPWERSVMLPHWLLSNGFRFRCFAWAIWASCKLYAVKCYSLCICIIIINNNKLQSFVCTRPFHWSLKLG